MMAKSECRGNVALEGCQGAPTVMPMACRQQPAGGKLGLAICFPPGSGMFMRENKRMCCSIHHCQGLSQAQKKKHLQYPTAGRKKKKRWNMNIWKHDSTADTSGWEFCLCVFEQAMLSTCITFPFTSDNIHTTKTGRRDSAKGRERDR